MLCITSTDKEYQEHFKKTNFIDKRNSIIFF